MLNASFINAAELRKKCESTIAYNLRIAMVHDALLKVFERAQGKKITKRILEDFKEELLKNSEGDQFWDWTSYEKETTWSGKVGYKISLRLPAQYAENEKSSGFTIDTNSVYENADGTLDVDILRRRWENSMGTIADLQAKLPNLDYAVQKYNDALAALSEAGEFGKNTNGHSVYPLASEFMTI